MAISYFAPIEIAPGTQPSLDNTSLNTLHYTATNKVQFIGKDALAPRLAKIPGWVSLAATTGLVGFLGACRSVFSYTYQQKRTVFGTSKRLYVLQQGSLYNITPLQTSSTAAADSLATNYTTLGNNPISTVNASKTVTFAHTAHKLLVGDSITIAGATATGGISTGNLNTTHIVRTVPNANSFTVTAAAAATSTATGGGNAVIEKTALITLTKATHGLGNGDRVWIDDAATTGGIPDTEINIEHIIRGVTANTFDVMCVTKATSSVSAGGGGSTIYYPPISAGNIDLSAGLGYGGGLYGAGLYGTAKTFTNVLSYPTIWSFGRFGNDLICCPGNGGFVYAWDGDLTVAPTRLTNSPTNNDWIAVSNNAVLSFYGNSARASSVGDATIWSPAATNTAYTDDIEGVSRIISQAKAGTANLLFTENEAITFIYVNLPDIWLADFALKDDGIIGPKARVEMEDYVFWMGSNGIYMFDGSNVQKCPNNTCHEYIYRNLNRTQAYKTFIRPDAENDQFIIHFPTGSSSEPNEYVIVNYKRWDWTLGTMDRTAAEEPTTVNGDFSYMANAVSNTVNGSIYKHGKAWVDADGVAMQAYAETNYKWLQDGKKTLELLTIVPDSLQAGDLTFTTYIKNWPQGGVIDTIIKTVTPATEKVDLQAAGRLRKYRWESNEIGGDMQLGMWVEEVQQGGSH